MSEKTTKTAPKTLIVRTAKGAKRRCRGGLCFGKQPTGIVVSKLTKEQLAAIQADDYLVTE